MHTETLCNGNLKRVLSKPGAGYWTPTLDRNNDFLNWMRDLDIVANAVDFTRQYKMRLDKVADIVFWKSPK